jgi:radical SAM protein with 4Fe4S-binding SPASM domain
MLDVKLRLQEDPAGGQAWMSLSALRTLTWSVTRACNLRCAICLSDAGVSSPEELTFSEAEQMLEGARRAGVEEVLLTGGEPFFHERLIDLLALMARLGLGARVATNGSLVSDEALRRIRAEAQVRSFQVSLDTLDPELYSRIHGCTPATLGVVLRALERMRAFGFRASISARLTPETLFGLPELLERALAEGWPAVTIHLPLRVHRFAGGGYDAGTDLLALLGPVFEIFQGLAERGAIETHIPWAEHHEVFQRFGGRLRIVHRGCEAGRGRLAVTPEGVVVPCECMALPAATLGDVRRDDLDAIFRESPLCQLLRDPASHGICAGCDQVGVCGGGCRAAALAQTAQIDGQDTTCPLWRASSPGGGSPAGR